MTVHQTFSNRNIENKLKRHVINRHSLANVYIHMYTLILSNIHIQLVLFKERKNEKN